MAIKGQHQCFLYDDTVEVGFLLLFCFALFLTSSAADRTHGTYILDKPCSTELCYQPHDYFCLFIKNISGGLERWFHG